MPKAHSPHSTFLRKGEALHPLRHEGGRAQRGGMPKAHSPHSTFLRKGEALHPLRHEGGRAQRGGMPKTHPPHSTFLRKGEALHPLRHEGGRAQRGGMPKTHPPQSPFLRKGEVPRRITSQLPATVMRSIRIDPVRMCERRSTSAPIAAMPANMSRRFEAMVISSTGYAMAPSSTQNPAAPRE